MGKGKQLVRLTVQCTGDCFVAVLSIFSPVYQVGHLVYVTWNCLCNASSFCLYFLFSIFILWFIYFVMFSYTVVVFIFVRCSCTIESQF